MNKSQILKGFNSFIINEAHKDSPREDFLVLARYLRWTFEHDGKHSEFVYLKVSFALHVIKALSLLRTGYGEITQDFRHAYLTSSNFNSIPNLVDIVDGDAVGYFLNRLKIILETSFVNDKISEEMGIIVSYIEAAAVALRNAIVVFLSDVWMNGFASTTDTNPDKIKVIVMGSVWVTLENKVGQVFLRMNLQNKTEKGIEIIFPTMLLPYSLPSYSCEGLNLATALFVIDQVVQYWRQHIELKTEIPIHYLDKLS